MLGLPLIDLIVIVIYFTGIIIIGLWAMRRIKNQEDYFLGGRRFGKFIQTFAAFGQGTSADTAVGVTTTTYTNGAAGIWSSLIYLFPTPMYWLTMPWMRRLRLLTLGDFFEERYNSKALAGIYAIIGTIGMMTCLSLGLSAMTKTVQALTPKSVSEFTVAEKAEFELAVELDHLKTKDYNQLTSAQKVRLSELNQLQPGKRFSHLDTNILLWTICLIIIIYAVTGGLEAAFISDTIQGIFIIILSVLMIPFALHKINSIFGGTNTLDALKTMHSQLSESSFEIFGSPSAIDFTWYYILALAVMGSINVMIQPNQLVATGSAKDEYTSRLGFVSGSFIKRFVTVFWGFFALLAMVLYHDQVNNPDLVWGFAALDLLGPLNLGLVGVMISALLAALMSSADCHMLTSASLLTHNIYQPLVPNRSEKHYIFIGRIMGIFYLVGGTIMAIQFDSILQILKFAWELNVTVAASFWLGMKWRRANATASWWSISVTSLIFFILPTLIPALWTGMTTDEDFLKTTHPEPIVRQYSVKEMDLKNRQAEIVKWEQLDATQKKLLQKPVELRLGETFEKTFILPQKAIFWTKGIKSEPNGQQIGSGMFNFELYLLDILGFQLEKNSYALNETIRIMIRTLIPFLIFILVACFTQPVSKKKIDRFFVKMKTKVIADPTADAEELAISYANPQRFNHLKLFPKSNWELDKWDKEDIWGFLISVLGVLVVIGLLTFLVRFGG